jgi:hypothetical protein
MTSIEKSSATIRCSFKFALFKSNLTCCVVCGFTLQTDEWCGVFTIDFSRPTLRINEHPILVTADFSQWLFNLFTNEIDSRVPCKYRVGEDCYDLLYLFQYYEAPLQGGETIFSPYRLEM